MSLFENAILLINELIQIRKKQITILKGLDNIKEYTPLQFKIKNYNLWIESLNNHISNNTNKVVNKEDILKYSFTDKLKSHLIELLETNNIKEIENAKSELSKIDSVNSVETTQSPQSPQSPQLDTSKIEAQPKILNGEVRPSDIRGGSIFDLRYVHGIGPVNAIKLVDNGVTLEGLLSEWKSWTIKDPSNSILMPSKMNKPKQYTKEQWKSFNISNQYNILETILKKKLIEETKQLHKIHKSSLVGIKYFNDMSQKIPRNEITKAESILKKIASHMNKDLLVTICGSYRRGRDKSGDVDCLITHPLIKTKDDLDNNPINLLHNFVKLLIDNNFIIDQLDMGNKKFMGFCNIMQFIKPKTQDSNSNSNSNSNANSNAEKHIARRIDIRFVPFESYGSSILYFTGSKTFNTNMRKHALKKNYSLNEFGLTKVSDGTIIPCATEEEIFKILEYPYKKPEERDI